MKDFSLSSLWGKLGNALEYSLLPNALEYSFFVIFEQLYGAWAVLFLRFICSI